MAQLIESSDGEQTAGVDRSSDQNVGRGEGSAETGVATNRAAATIAAPDGDRWNTRRPARGTLPSRPAKKHVILFLAANPSGTDRVALDREARAIHVELKRSGFGIGSTSRREGGRADRLAPRAQAHIGAFQRLWRDTNRRETQLGEQPIVAADASTRGELYLRDATGVAEAVLAQAIAQALDAAGTSFKLVVLNACYTAPIAEALLAKRLDRRGTAASVGWSDIARV